METCTAGDVTMSSAGDTEHPRLRDSNTEEEGRGAEVEVTEEELLECYTWPGMVVVSRCRGDPSWLGTRLRPAMADGVVRVPMGLSLWLWGWVFIMAGGRRRAGDRRRAWCRRRKASGGFVVVLAGRGRGKWGGLLSGSLIQPSRFLVSFLSCQFHPFLLTLGKLISIWRLGKLLCLIPWEAANVMSSLSVADSHSEHGQA